jgi:hypothetical protein
VLLRVSVAFAAERYLDFGPTLAREKLIELHRISVSKETLRQWMTEAGIWVSCRERKKRVFQSRGRRDCFGELVQIDGSHHWWFEKRGPKCALLVYIDDGVGYQRHAVRISAECPGHGECPRHPPACHAPDCQSLSCVSRVGGQEIRAAVAKSKTSINDILI